MMGDDKITDIPPPSRTGAPSADHGPLPYDPWRDRLRVILDRCIYAGALVAVSVLAAKGKLTTETLVGILVVAGIRPHNLFEAAARQNNGNGVKAVMLLPLLDNLRSGTWLAR